MHSSKLFVIYNIFFLHAIDNSAFRKCGMEIKHYLHATNILPALSHLTRNSIFDTWCLLQSDRLITSILTFPVHKSQMYTALVSIE